jgi:GTP-binding protein
MKLNSLFDGWMEYAGEMASRPTGALVADRPGESTAFALWNLQGRGEFFLAPGIEVYDCMIVGENSRDADMDVNITKGKKQTNMRASSADEAIRLVPHRVLTLEAAIEFIADDEYVEVTPKSIRLRKKVLDMKKRRGAGSRGSQTPTRTYFLGHNDSAGMRQFVRIDLGRDRLPQQVDESKLRVLTTA